VMHFTRAQHIQRWVPTGVIWCAWTMNIFLPHSFDVTINSFLYTIQTEGCNTTSLQYPNCTGSWIHITILMPYMDSQNQN
jgi:hypothetical protein